MTCRACNKTFKIDSQNISIHLSNIENKLVVHLICDCKKEKIDIIEFDQNLELINKIKIRSKKDLYSIITAIETTEEYSFIDNSTIDLTEIKPKKVKETPIKYPKGLTYFIPSSKITTDEYSTTYNEKTINSYKTELYTYTE